MGLLYQAGLTTVCLKRKGGKIEIQARIGVARVSPVGKLRQLEKLACGRRIFSGLRIKVVRKGPWAKAYQRHLKPFRLLGKSSGAQNSSVWIDPSGRTPPRLCPDTIYLQASLAFGTGTHPTTRMAASLLHEALTRKPGARVLDMGCGTGILGILARRWRASEVLAVDHDPEAIKICRQNLRINQIRGVILKKSLRGLRSRYGIIAANITADVLGELAPVFLRGLTPGGFLVLSGLLYRDVPEIRKNYKTLRLVRRLNLKGWSTLLLQKKISKKT